MWGTGKGIFELTLLIKSEGCGPESPIGTGYSMSSSGLQTQRHSSGKLLQGGEDGNTWQYSSCSELGMCSEEFILDIKVYLILASRKPFLESRSVYSQENKGFVISSSP